MTDSVSDDRHHLPWIKSAHGTRSVIGGAWACAQATVRSVVMRA